ncbi:3613_t:CDS:2 [Cetraspora pellucida]|uniref:3613_t:CDS:1 n=1 Tax=Cetraspora pellucida TaxID=1433469 RepID=A0ACA9N4F7_9GLOM|nr:3613_t:CDS:2 [Cetraspora pellucida]
MGHRHSKFPKLIHKINKATNDKIRNTECPQLNKQDDLYLDRMQVLHNVMRCISNGNFKAPVDEQLREGSAVVLDVCSGTATWLSEMASDFPQSTFIGIEKVHMYPDHKPRNIKIIQADVLEQFPFSGDKNRNSYNTFDLIYSRLNFFAFSESQWKNHLIKEYIRVLKPGGYIECVEGDLNADNPGAVTEQLGVVVENILVQGGRSLSLFMTFNEMIESHPQMGKVTRTEVAMPIGSWGGQIGELGLAIMLHMLSGLQKGIMYHMKLNEKDLDKLWDDYKIEVNSYHTKWKIHRFLVQKNWN